MSIRTGKLTVFFEEPFWVGIFERVENGKLSVSKVTFGTEPKDYEIWEFVLKEYDRLQFSPSVEVTEKELTKNPKKLQREIHKQMLDRGTGTKSQQALKLQQEQRMILSRLVDTFFSRISLTMQLSPKPHNTAYVLPWEEGLHWQSRSSGCSSN